MTIRTNGDQDQAPSKPATAGQETKAKDASERRELHASSSAVERSRLERRRRSQSLGIGAPLTAAFIGGLLVIENLADADQPDEDGATVASDDELSAEGDDVGAPELAPGAAVAGMAAADIPEEATGAEDPEAAPSEDGSFRTGGADGEPTPDMPTIAADGAGAPMPEGDSSGPSEADLTFVDINIGEGEGEAAIDPIVEEDILIRNSQVGTRGDDVLFGTDGDDAISGGSGDDIIHGGDGRDLLNGNDGDDQLFGGAGNDNLKGGSGNDILDGGADNDVLLGGVGDDVLIVNGRFDVALDYDSPANSGSDTLVVRQGYADDMAESGVDRTAFFFSSEHWGDELPSGVADHTQQVAVGIEHLTLEGTADHDIVADSYDNRLSGNDGSNRIHAGGGDDRVLGGAGGDDLRGGTGDDELFGGSGDDMIEGGLGDDMLYGDGGDDVFILGLHDAAIDTVFDHEGANRLQIDGVTDETIEASLLGDDLYLTADDTPFARIRDYVGHEDAIDGIDFGEGLRSVDSMLTDHPDLEGALDEVAARAAEASADDLLSAHLHLTEPTISGEPRTNQRLDGTEEDDWLSGYDGKDVLFGKDGDDILAGGDGVDDLRGGAGDDRYLFEEGEQGIDKIKDTEGRNLAELRGYDRADIEGAMLGDDLAVLADGEILFTVQDFASNEGSFHGVQAGNRFIQTEDLLA